MAPGPWPTKSPRLGRRRPKENQYRNFDFDVRNNFSIKVEESQPSFPRFGRLFKVQPSKCEKTTRNLEKVKILTPKSKIENWRVRLQSGPLTPGWGPFRGPPAFHRLLVPLLLVLASSIGRQMEWARVQWHFLLGVSRGVSLWILKLFGYCATA